MTNEEIEQCTKRIDTPTTEETIEIPVVPFFPAKDADEQEPGTTQ